MSTLLVRPPYNRRNVPLEYDRSWLSAELSNIQRSIPSEVSSSIASNYTANAMDTLLLVDATTAAITITLLAPARAQGMRLTIKKIDASAHAVTVGGTVDGAVNPTLATQYKAMTVQSDGAAWWKIAVV